MVKPIGQIGEQNFNAEAQRGRDAGEIRELIFNARTQRKKDAKMGRSREAGKNRDWYFLRYTQESEAR